MNERDMPREPRRARLSKAAAAADRAQKLRTEALYGALLGSMLQDGNAETRLAAGYIRNALYAYSDQDVATTAEHIRLAAIRLNQVAGWVG